LNDFERHCFVFFCVKKQLLSERTNAFRLFFYLFFFFV